MKNDDNKDINIENTDKLDYAEINRRFREEQYFLNGQDPYAEENRQRESRSQVSKNKKKRNYTPFLVFLTSLLVITTIILVAWTLANNNRINKKLDSLDNLKQTELVEETETQETKTTKESKETEETQETEATEETKETENGEQKSGKLTQDLNFRSGPGYDYDVIGTIPAGAEVSGYLEKGWLKVEYNGQTGYIGPKYVQ